MGTLLTPRLAPAALGSVLCKVSRNGRNAISPISRHFLSFLLFLDTFSLILDLKCLEMGMMEKALVTRGPNNLLDV